MSEARKAIFARLNQRRVSATKQDCKAPLATKHLNKTEAKNLLIEKLQENRAEVYSIPSSSWTETLTAIATERGYKTWLFGKNLSGAKTASKALESVSNEISVIQYDSDYETLREVLFHQVDVSVTSVKAAIAETGTLLLIPDKNEPRMMSLIPPVHIAILKQSDIVTSFQQIANNPPWQGKNMPTNILFISSPSKTADIQQTIAYGAHGPKKLIVLIIN